MGEVIFHVVLLVVSALFLKESFVIGAGREVDPIGPAGFPQAILIIILLLLVVSLFKAIRNMKAVRDEEEEVNLNGTFFGIIVSIAVFIFMSEIISFALATIVFCFAMFYILGERKKLKMTINSLVIAVIVMVVFGKILSLPLPRGMGIIKELTYFLY